MFQDGGSIILNASVGSSKAFFEAVTLYGTSMAAVRSFARSWTVDLKRHKIRVNAISPGPTDTPDLARLSEQKKTTLLSIIPMGRMGTPDEVAKAVAFLASDDSSYITGIELSVNGGIAQI